MMNIRVKVLKPLHVEGEKTIQPSETPIEMEESKAKILSAEEIKAVEILKDDNQGDLNAKK